jgi:hypothetical protein
MPQEEIKLERQRPVDWNGWNLRDKEKKSFQPEISAFQIPR